MFADSARARLEGLAKPPGSLGRLEALAASLAGVQRRSHPTTDDVRLLLFAGDHGMVASGVARYPATVTAAMVTTMLDHRASASAIARAVGVSVTIIDAGVAGPLPASANLVRLAVGLGTADASERPAMTATQAGQCLARGAAVARAAIADGADVLALGEMGIGNSASAALLAHRLVPARLAACVGPGAGQDAAGLARKRAVVKRAAARTATTRPLEVLAEFGGFEIGMMAGVCLAGAATGVPVVVDGFIATAAALLAARLRPSAREAMVFAHRSAEPGHGVMLDALAAEPLLDLGLRLGEGTGALLAVPLLRAACALLRDVATLDEVLARMT